MFINYYGEQSCTAGRPSFITGQSGLRTGLTRSACRAASLGLQKEDPQRQKAASFNMDDVLANLKESSGSKQARRWGLRADVKPGR